jgi:hypothetical protein
LGEEHIFNDRMEENQEESDDCLVVLGSDKYQVPSIDEMNDDVLMLHVDGTAVALIALEDMNEPVMTANVLSVCNPDGIMLTVNMDTLEAKFNY